MLGGCSRLAARHAGVFVRPSRSLATAPKSLLDLLTESTSIPTVDHEEVAPVQRLRQKIDYLRKVIEKAGSKTQFLEVVERHSVVMHGGNLVECWRRISVMVEFGVDIESLRWEPGFRELEESTCSKLPSMHPSLLVELCKIFWQLDIPADSKLIESLCLAVKSRFKDISLSELIVMQYSLTKVPGSSVQLDVMRLSTPVLFQTRVRAELETETPRGVRRALMFALAENLDPETVEYVANVSLRHLGDIPIHPAYVLVELVASKREKLTGSIREVLTACIDQLARHESELTEKHISVIYECCQKQEIGSAALFEAFWKVASSWTPEMVTALLKAGFKMNYFSLPAAENAVDLILEDRDQLLEEIEVPRLAGAVALVALNHNPDSEKYRQALLAGCILAGPEPRVEAMVANHPYQLAEMLLCLGAVELFPEQRLYQLFDEAYQRTLCDDPLSCAYVVELEHCLTLKLGACHPYKAIPELKAVAENHVAESPILKSLTLTLNVALGGEKFVAKKVITPLGTRADYLIAMRRGEYAMAFADGKSHPLAKIPPDSKVVAVLLERDVEDNPGRTGLMKLRLNLRERHLQAQNICTVVVNVAEFESLRAFERTPFVMKKIREVIRGGPIYNNTHSPASGGELR